MKKIILIVILFISGCATVFNCDQGNRRVSNVIRYNRELRGASKDQVLNLLGQPISQEVYLPRCNKVETLKYDSCQCLESLYLVLVNEIVTDVGYW